MARRAPLWLFALFGGAGIALVPWTLVLASRLPARHLALHWDVTWVGFDVALAAVLLATGVAALRRAPAVQRLASAAAALLVCDAWFDVLTAATAGQRVVAAVEAGAAELPLAVVCILVAAGRLERVKAA